MNEILAALLSFVVSGAVAWALLAATKFGLLLVFGSSPFAANGTEILLGALLLFLAAIEAGR